MKKILLVWVLSISVFGYLQAQEVDRIVAENINGVKLFQTNNIYSYPIISLNSVEALELHFDDLDGDVKNYYYSFQLCNADWTPSELMSFDYIKGFQSTRIRTYRNSSISLNNYMHYQATIPERNSMPSRSGNYLLKVFLNDDTTQLVFAKRFLVVDKKVNANVQIKAPFGGQLFRTHQRIQVTVNTASANINTVSQQDIKIRVLQNYSWSNSKFTDRPTIYRGNYYEYSDDALSFPAGREWRWIDLRSLRLMSDRMAELKKGTQRTDVYVKTDADRSRQAYLYTRDNNGLFTLENEDRNNPYWQSDYAYTHFSFSPPGGIPFRGKELYLYGELTHYALDESSKMVFNELTGKYEKTLFLKQGYYNYAYASVEELKKNEKVLVFDNTEGNFQETDNRYTVLIYYRPFGGRSDELIGFTEINSFGSF